MTPHADSCERVTREAAFNTTTRSEILATFIDQPTPTIHPLHIRRHNLLVVPHRWARSGVRPT
jgi:hypothetical protein